MLNHIKTIQLGEPGYLTPAYSADSLKTIDVYFDNKRYVYKRPARFNLKDWKLTLIARFNATRVAGSGRTFYIIKD